MVMARIALLALLLITPLPAASQDSLLTRVIDTGPGLASVTEIPGGFYMVYDTGHWSYQTRVSRKMLASIPDSAAVNLLVLSHSDGDHLSATDEIFARRVDTVLRTGLPRPSRTNWKHADSVIRQAADNGTTKVFNLRDKQIEPGRTFHLGDATVTFLAGDDCPRYAKVPRPNNCMGNRDSKAINAGSIVLRLEYAGRSILFTGDAVGRKEGTADTAKAIATEAELLDRKDEFPIKSDVIIAPHHGADNGSSRDFIEEASPVWVIFPAGHMHEHPHQATACRYIEHGVAVDHILRTDRGDDEGGKEWDHGTHDGDTVGDDDIIIIIREDSTLTVQYRDGNPPDGEAKCKGRRVT